MLQIPDQISLDRLIHGAAVVLPGYGAGELARIFAGERLVAIGKRVAGNLFHPKTVLVSPGEIFISHSPRDPER